MFPSYPPLSLSISSRHITQTSGGRWRNQYPWSLSTGYIHCSLHNRSWAANLAGEKYHVTCANYLCIYGYGSSWGDQRDPWCERMLTGAVDKMFKWFFVGQLWDNEWEREKSQSVNGDIRLDEGMPEEARTVEWASGWTLTAWLLKSLAAIIAIHLFHSCPCALINEYWATSVILLTSDIISFPDRMDQDWIDRHLYWWMVSTGIVYLAKINCNLILDMNLFMILFLIQYPLKWSNMKVEAAKYIPSFQINAFKLSTYRILKKKKGISVSTKKWSSTKSTSLKFLQHQ